MLLFPYFHDHNPTNEVYRAPEADSGDGKIEKEMQALSLMYVANKDEECPTCEAVEVCEPGTLNQTMNTNQLKTTEMTSAELRTTGNR